MQTERRRRPADRARRGEGGHRRAEPRGNRPVAAVTSVSSSAEQVSRPKETVTTMQQEETQAGDEEEEEEEEERGRGRDGRRRRRRTMKESESDGRGRRAASEGGEETGTKLRWRLHQLEKEKLELTSGHNRELCRLQAELTRLRSSVERGEAQGAELQYQLTLSQRDAARAVELSLDKHSLTERAAELQQTVQELQRALDITRQAREEDQHALQQEVEERDKLIHSLSSENQQLHRLLQEQEEALEERERRMEEAREEREKEAREEREKEAEANRRQADELKYLMEREERSRREKEASDQRLRSLESNIEAERAAHLESKFNSELVQLRVRDLEAAVAVERSGQQEAQCGLELLRAQLREAERGRSLERERRGGAERALERLQAECEQCKSDLGAALETERKTTSDLSRRLEEEKKQHGETGSRLQQSEEAHVNCVQKIRETLQQHNITGCSPPAVHDGSSSAEVLRLLKRTLEASELRLKETQTQVQELQQENRLLGQMTSDQSRQVEGSREESVRLEEELTRLRQQGSDWSTQSRELRAELQREREERAREVQRTTDDYDKESKVRLSFLYCLYQRLLAGCVLLTQPHSILGNFTWTELCDVIGEQVDRLTSDLREANDKIARLRLAGEKKSVCVHKLQRALSRLEESARRREEARSNELQACRSECGALRGRVSSLTSDLSGGRGESASLLAACALLAGALRHAHLRLRTLCEQKRLVCRRLAEGEALEEEVRRLAGALGGEEEEEEGGRRAARRWRRSVWAVLAARRWRALTKETTVLFRLERGGGGGGGGGVPDVCVCGDATTRADEVDEGREGREGVCARWLRSKRLSSTIVSSMADLQGALEHTGSAPADVTAAARSSLSRLLDHLLDQSDAASRRADAGDDAVSWRLTLPPRTNTKALVSALQQHFLLFSQRLHSAEVERRSLRLEAANLKRGLRQEREREDTCSTVPAERFHSVCAELRQALSREQEAQGLIQEQTERLHALQRDPQCTLGQSTQALSDARQEASRRKRTLRILGKHLLGVQSEKKQLEERLRRAEGELRDRRTDDLISGTKTSQTEVTVETPPLVPLPEEKEESKPPGPSHPNPAPSSPVFKTKEKKTTKKKKKSVGLVKSVRRTTDRFSVVV